jgi:large-conductance mechanosensitive channel
MAARQRARTVNPTQAVTTGTTIRIEQPKSSRQQKQNITVVMAQEHNPVGGFIDFLREHAIVSLAVGFAIATQLQTLVKQLIASFINPLYALLFNGQQLSNLSTTVHWHGRQQTFGWGAFVYDLVDLVFVLVVIYVLVKLLRLDSLDSPKPDKKEQAKKHL